MNRLQMYIRVIQLFTFIVLNFLFSNAKATETCPLFFQPDCLINSLKPALSELQLKDMTDSDQIRIAQLSIEVSLPKAFQAKAWPYHYKDNRMEAIRNFLNTAQSQNIYKQVKDHSDRVKQKIQAGHAYSFSFAECMKLDKSWYNPFLTTVFCTSRQMRKEKDLNNIYPYIRAMKNHEQSALLQYIYADQSEHGELHQASRTAAELIYLAAVQPQDIQYSTRLFIIRTQLAYGLSELASQEIKSFIPDVSLILPAQHNLQYYHTWTELLEETAKLNLNPTDQDKNKSFLLLKQEAHLNLMATASTLPVIQQMETHRLLVQGIFYSYFSSNTALDMFMAYHIQKWQSLFPKLSRQQQTQEGLDMMIFELKAASFFDHQARKIKNYIKKKT